MKIFLLCGLFLVAFNNVLGCSYLGSPDPPLDYITAKTEKIFLGEVLSMEVFEKKYDGERYVLQKVKLKVLKAFKGVKENTVDILFWEKKKKSSCDEAAPKPSPTEKWVVFKGYDEGDYIRFVRQSQWLNFKYDEEKHKELLARLESVTQNPLTTVNGQVTKYGLLSYCPPIKNRTVRIAGDYVKLETETDDEGRFSFKNIPPGKYKVTIELAFNAEEMFNPNKQKTVFHQPTLKYLYEYETNVGFRDADYQYFVFFDEADKGK